MRSRRPDLQVIVLGCMVTLPIPGVLVQVLHYMRGLRALGFDPWYVEDSNRWVYDPVRMEPAEGGSRQLALLEPFLRKYDLLDRFCYRPGPGAPTFAPTAVDIDALYRSTDVLLNVTGAQELRDEHLSVPLRAYIESDPFASQVKYQQGEPFTREQLDAHTHLFTFGENMGQRDCLTPPTGHTWISTRQPIDLSLWSTSEKTLDAYRTITTWSNKGKDVDWNGERYYWTKDREFLKYLDLPEQVDPELVLATSVDGKTARLLGNAGWKLDGSNYLPDETDRYMRYIEESRGEFTIARDQYWRPRTGWFSDRSSCYLASGRPVVTQETGFSQYIPTGDGLFSFSTMDEAVAAIETIESDYERHRAAAREIAVEFFDATKVLSALLDAVYAAK